MVLSDSATYDYNGTSISNGINSIDCAITDLSNGDINANRLHTNTINQITIIIKNTRIRNPDRIHEILLD